MQEAGAVLGPVKVVIPYLKRCVAHRWSVLGQGRNHEALVFLHGFNCCLADACKTLAQFLALANLPPHIRPFLFSWPTGTFHNYITAIKRGAQGEQTQLDFVGALLEFDTVT